MNQRKCCEETYSWKCNQGRGLTYPRKGADTLYVAVIAISVVCLAVAQFTPFFAR